MKPSNGYISLSHAMTLIENGWNFQQNLAQTEFKVKRQGAFYKLNKDTATELKKRLIELRKQTKLL